MYYKFSSKMVSWYNSTLRAEPSAETLQFQDYMSQYERHWWLAKPAPESPRVPLSFFVDGRAPMLDNYFTGTLFDLYSGKLISLLQEKGIHFEAFPAILIDKATGINVPSEYWVFHLLERESISEEALASLNTSLNMKHLLLQLQQEQQHNSSDTVSVAPEMNGETTSQQYDDTTKLMFRVAQQASAVLIHERLKIVLDKTAITGCQYHELVP